MITTATTPEATRSAGAGLAICVAAGTVSALGTAIQSFALTWQASAFGPHAAGLATTLGIMPRVLLMLVGGAAADRYGIRRVMIICDAFLTGTLTAALCYLCFHPAGLILIITLSMIGSAVSAFYLPASGGFVRLFVTADRLPRVMARVGSLQQIARLVGPPLAAVLVITLGLSGVIGLDLISFVVVLVALSIIRPPFTLRADDDAAEKMITGVLTAIRAARRTPGMVPALTATALVAGSVLPILYLIVPLDVRARHWGVATAGWLESAWIVGTLTITVIIALTGTYARAGLMVMVGPLTAAIGGATIAAAPTIPVALGGSVLMGIGTAVFTGHLTPLFLAWTPPAFTARFQALYGIVQAVAMLLVNLPYGLVAGTAGPGTAMLTAAIVCGAASVLVLANRRLRSARNPVRQPADQDG